MLAPAIMVQGTASSVGKSILTTALCRMFRQDGLRVLPFKSQNMALNAYVTPEGGEIGRAQAVQAEACGVPAHVDMNPILLKPEGDAKSQVVLLGKSIGSLGAAEFHRRKPEFRALVGESLERLRRQCDVLVIEGAGSPAEVNLRPRDIVNMHVAHAADARVLLVGDIDKGGVFAAFVGTMELLDAADRARVGAFVINKFRGDASLLTSGLEFLEAKTGVPTLGVVPMVPSLRIADEDSVSLDHRLRRDRARRDEIEIAVVRFPRISNHDDFAPLESEPGVVVRFVEDAAELGGTDLVILPGSKSTVSDLAWLRARGLADALMARATRGEPVLGICGGSQMLGARIVDPEGIESPDRDVSALDLLPARTVFGPGKRTALVEARATMSTFLASAGESVKGYEIHSGHFAREGGGRGPFEIATRSGATTHDVDGAVSASGAVVGTMLHGLFEVASVRNTLLSFLRSRRGLPAPTARPSVTTNDAEFDRLAAVVRASLDRSLLRRLARLEE